jgi:hypothetical protein
VRSFTFTALHVRVTACEPVACCIFYTHCHEFIVGSIIFCLWDEQSNFAELPISSMIIDNLLREINFVLLPFDF